METRRVPGMSRPSIGSAPTSSLHCSLDGELGEVDLEGSGEAAQAGPASSAAEDVLGIDLEDPVVVVLGAGCPGRVGTAPLAGAVVDPLVLADDALPARQTAR